ncbi:hypothetical protein ACET3Z_013232 [Daucus carota]
MSGNESTNRGPCFPSSSGTGCKRVPLGPISPNSKHTGSDIGKTLSSKQSPPTYGCTDSPLFSLTYASNPTSGISVETLVSRLIKTGVGISQPGHAFDIPASSIRIRDSHDSVVTRQKLLESYNRDSSSSARRKEDRRYINVTFPDPEQIFRSRNGGHANAARDHPRSSTDASTFGGKNMMSHFNEAGVDSFLTDFTTQNQVYESILADDELDDEEAHRGEYLSDACN